MTPHPLPAHRVTRVAIVASGTSRPPLPEGVTFLALPKGPLGERPDTPVGLGCIAAIDIFIKAADRRTFRCTRAYKHEGPHVAHGRGNLPLIAWVDDPDHNEATDE